MTHIPRFPRDRVKNPCTICGKPKCVALVALAIASLSLSGCVLPLGMALTAAGAKPVPAVFDANGNAIVGEESK